MVLKEKFARLSKKADSFYHSNLYLTLITLIGILGFIFREEIIAIYLIISFAAIGLIMVRDISPFFIAVLILGMVPLARHGQANYFSPLIYVVIPLVIAIIARTLIFPRRIRLGRFFIPTLAVAIAITFSGLFFITVREYFSLPAIYYIAGLGVGMLIFYVIMESNIPQFSKEGDVDFFARIMVAVGIMGIMMIASSYISNYTLIGSDFRSFQSRFQWGNNLSCNLLLSMPFSFYLAAKSKYTLFYFIIGVIQYFSMVLSLSRGGILFSTLIMPFVVVTCLVYAKEKRKKLLIALGILIAVFALALLRYIDVIERLLTFTRAEGRLHLYGLAWNNFLQRPIFGKGLAYNPYIYYEPKSMCIYWYHSTLFQILASLGLVGLFAYALQTIYRLRAIFEVKSRFNLFTLYSILGFAAYSMVNVGYFVPLPYVVVMLFMFIILDRNNALIKNVA